MVLVRVSILGMSRLVYQAYQSRDFLLQRCDLCDSHLGVSIICNLCLLPPNQEIDH